MHLRDAAYEAGKLSVKDLSKAFSLHLSIILECAIVAHLLLGFEQHLYMIVNGTECVRAYTVHLLLQALHLDNAASANKVNYCFHSW